MVTNTSDVLTCEPIFILLANAPITPSNGALILVWARQLELEYNQLLQLSSFAWPE